MTPAYELLRVEVDGPVVHLRLNRPAKRNAINNALKVALKGQDIPAFTIHDLRRTASTLLHENGWASDVVERALNHTVGGVRGVYNPTKHAPGQYGAFVAWFGARVFADHPDVASLRFRMEQVQLVGGEVRGTGKYMFVRTTQRGAR